MLPQITLRYTKSKTTKTEPMTNPEMVANHARTILSKAGTLAYQEEVLMFCLNGNNEIFGWVKISSGGFNFSAIDPRIVFSIALTATANTIILVHNHPSGSLLSSKEDQSICDKLKQAGELLNLQLLDFLIVTETSYISYKEQGKL